MPGSCIVRDHAKKKTWSQVKIRRSQFFFDYANSTMKCALIFCICSCAYVYETSCNLMACFFLDIDECTAGTHNCSTNTFCTNNVGSYNCTCNPGYYGDVENCEPGKSGLLRATWGVRNPNLKAVITHASHVCSMRSMEWMECTEPNFITRDWTFYHS